MTVRDAVPPVVVVGAGPVGLTTALLLGAHGLPVTVLEAAVRRDPTGSKAICMQRDVLDLLERVGVGAALAACGVTWQTGRTYYRDTEVLRIGFADRGRSAFPPFVNVSQATTERLLEERVAAEPRIAVRRGAAVVGLEQDDTGVTVAVEAADGGSTQVRGSYVVACDGSRSSVRQLLGLSFDGYSFDDKFLIADVRADLGFGHERRFFFDPEFNPGRQVLVHPQPDGVWRIDWQVPGDFDLDAERASGALDARIRAVTGETAYDVVWLSVYRFHQRTAPTYRVARVLLAGDAAHVMSPFGARGLNSGTQDAENIAWKLAHVLHGWAPERLLDSYDDERLAAARENLRVTGATMRFLVPHTGADRDRRTDILARSATDESARREIDSGRLAEPFWYVDSPLVTPDPRRSPSWKQPEAGEAPDVVPGVLCPDGPVAVAGSAACRLRQLFGRAHVALVADHRSAAAHVQEVLTTATGAPTAAYALEAVDVAGVLREALRPDPGEVWLVRPDGHVAAVVPVVEDAAVVSALGRSLATAESG